MARTQARRHSGEQSRRFQAYRCQWCKRYHVGSRPVGRRARPPLRLDEVYSADFEDEE